MKNGAKKVCSVLCNQKGSMIVTVLVATTLMFVLGTILLFTSYTGYQMKVVERQSKLQFYDAESALNEIRAGIQLAVSDSIAIANTKVLENYQTASGAVDNSFQTYFLEELYNWMPENASDKLFLKNCTLTSPVYTGACYDASLLQGFISAEAQTNVTVLSDFAPASEKGKLTVTSDSVTMKGITIAFVKDGYASNITTDICIQLPNFTYQISSMALTDLPQYAIVATEGLEQNSGGSLTIAGDAYAGNVSISGNGNALHIGTASDGYQLVSGGAIQLRQYSTLDIGADSSVWASRIQLGTGCSADLAGDIYVADDLELSGDASAATVAGKYYGFGNSTTDAEHSSSIIINGHHTNLHFTNTLRTLMLAGHSFIGTGLVDSGIAGTNNTDKIMGESIATKNAQLAYLIPADCISNIAANPAIFSTDNMPTAQELKGYVNTTAPLWTGGGSLDTYGADVQLVYQPLSASGQTLLYFYMQFPDFQSASNYFSAYFQDNSSEIAQYMQLYSDSLQMEDKEDVLVSGNAMYYNDDGASSLLSPTASGFSDVATKLQEMYANLCTTLSASNAGSGTVFSNIVDAEKVENLSAERLFYEGGSASNSNVTGVIAQEDTTISQLLAEYPNLHVVISTQDVTVDLPFYGLILTNGKVHLQASLYLDQASVNAALQDTDAQGDKLWYYLVGGSETANNVIENDISWDLEGLVTYRNFRKH